MRIFISSEMKSSDDKAFRNAAIEEVEQLGHEAVCFEKLPGRPLANNQDAKDKCLEMVRESHLLIAIVDDTVTDVMGDEINQAYEHLGSGRIFLYFTGKGKRDSKAMALWESSKKSHIIKEFDSPDELRHEIARSIASYLNDAFPKLASRPASLVREEVKLQSGGQKWWRLALRKGDVVTITCMAIQAFVAGFYSREEFIRRRSSGLLWTFNFGNKSEKQEYTHKETISQDDDYYFIVRATLFPLFLQSFTVDVEIKRS